MARYLNDFLFQDNERSTAQEPVVINITTESKAVELMFISEYAVQADWQVLGPDPETFVDGDVNVTTNEVTLTGHNFTQNLVVQLTTTGTLPSGLSTGTDYRIDVVDADTIRFLNATTLAVIDITSAAGGGTHTISSETLANASFKLQGTNKPGILSWQDIPNSSTNITGDDGVLINVSNAGYGFVRAVVTLDSGSLNFTCVINGKSE